MERRDELNKTVREYIDAGKPIRTLVNTLNRMKIYTTRGNKWNYQTIYAYVKKMKTEEAQVDAPRTLSAEAKLTIAKKIVNSDLEGIIKLEAIRTFLGA